MTADEAKEYLDDKVSNAYLKSSYVGVKWRDVYKTAITALDKQIPKKGKIVIEGKPENGGSYGIRICPSCGKRIDIYGDYIGCPYCLQRVDWSEE